jgi:ketosteroid isomerase-like protein
MTTRETQASSVRELAEKYYACWKDLAFDRLGGVLSKDFVFRGAMDSADGPDAFIALAKRNAPMFDGASFGAPRQVVDGDRLVMLYDFSVRGITVPMAEAFEARDGRISRIDLYFDPTPFRLPVSG